MSSWFLSSSVIFDDWYSETMDFEVGWPKINAGDSDSRFSRFYSCTKSDYQEDIHLTSLLEALRTTL